MGKAANNYVYLAQIGTKLDSSSTLTDNLVLMGHVYYADGTDKIVIINTEDDYEKGTGSSKVTYANAFNAKVNADWAALDKIKDWDKYNEPLNGDEFDPETSGSVLGLYQINMKGGKAILTKYNEEFEDAYVSKGRAIVDTADEDGTSYRQNAKTVYFYIHGDYNDKDNPLEVVPYSGVNNIPSVKKSDNKAKAIQGFVDKKGAASSAVQALLVKFDIETSGGTLVYFFGGTKVEANFDKFNNSTVNYKVYDGDEVDRLSIQYKSLPDSNDAIRSLEKPGFVKENADGELEYIAGSYSVANDSKGHSPFNYVTENGKVYYVNSAEIVDFAGIHAHTFTAAVAADPAVVTAGEEDLLFPLYDIESVVDMRTPEEKRDAGSMTLNDVEDLLSLFALIGDNHDAEPDNDVANVKIDGLRVAISFTKGVTNLIKTVYILDNVDCEGHAPEGGESDTTVYFYGGSRDSANFDNLNNKTVFYNVYDGDQQDRLVVEYESLAEATNEIAKLREPGFVKVDENGKLDYIAGTWDGAARMDDANDPFATPVAGQNRFYHVKEDGDVYYVNYAEVAGVDGIAGIRNHTVTGKVYKFTGADDTDKTTEDTIENLLMPMYEIEGVVDLRTKDERVAAGGIYVDSVEALLTLFGYIEDNHDKKDGVAYTDNDVPGVKIDGLRIAISFTGDAAGDKTDVIKTIYILDNVDCDEADSVGSMSPGHLWDLSGS